MVKSISTRGCTIFEDENGREYVLVYEDFPGNTFLDDELTHEVVKLGQEVSIRVSLTPGVKVDNVVGYFTLYRETANR